LEQAVQSALSGQTTLSPQQYQALKTLAGSDHFDSQIDALEAAIEQCDKDLIKVWSHLGQDSYQHFYEFMNREDGFTLSPHQKLMSDLLMEAETGKLLRCMISLPPGHAKSTHCSHHFPAWFLGRNPKKRYLQAGHSQDFVANEMGAKVRNIIASEDYHHVFPDIHIARDMRAKDYWALNNNKGKYVAKGVGQGIAGFRGMFGGVDDPYKNRQAAESQTIRETTYQWFADDFATRLLPGSPLFIVMTRWHSDDIVGRITERERIELKDILAKEDIPTPEDLDLAIMKQMVDKLEGLDDDQKKFRYNIINLPAISEEDGDILGRKRGEALWPELFSVSELEAMKANMNSSSWNSLYQGTPIDIEGGTVSKEWFKTYDVLPKPEDIKRITLSVDTASKQNERNDFTVIGVWIQDRHNNHYLADVYRQQPDFVELQNQIAILTQRWKATAILVEDRGNGTSYLQLHQGKSSAPAPLIAIEVGQNSKEFRFDRVTPMIEGGQVFLPIHASWLADYMKELVSFPSGKHDDQVDMTSQYLEHTRKGGKRGSRKLGGTGLRR
jgi:predicted phage terminase large subunit-like protein